MSEEREGVHRAVPVIIAVIALISGCASPLAHRSVSDELRSTIVAAIDLELREVPADSAHDEPRTTTQPPSAVERELQDRRDELDAIAPALPFVPGSAQPGLDLAGQSQDGIAMSLRDAVNVAVANNLLVRQARLQPAITWEQVLAAQAVFDTILFANLDYQRTDEQTPVRIITPPGDPPILLGTGINALEAWRFETGVRQPLWWGGEAYLSTDMTRTRNLTPGVELSPDPAYNAAVRMGLVQPLLRGFGADANLSTIRLTRNIHRRAIYDLHRELLDLVVDTEQAYWDLVFAWANLEIQEWLVREGLAVRDSMEARRQFDVQPAQYADSVATVEQRRADVIRARREVRAASDRLKRLLNDPELSIAAEELIVPTDVAAQSPMTFSLRDSIMTAIAQRPEIEQAISFIDDAEIRRALATTELLPQLNFLAEIAFTGLDEGVGSAYREANRGDFINYLLGLAFEWPIGSRAAAADLRRTRLERSAATLAYRDTIQQVILDVKNALRDVVVNYELIGATRSFRVAQAENLRAFTVREELAGMTPEYLNLLFQRQATLAAARQQEVQAEVNFDQAVARLYRALGTGLSMHGIEVETDDER